MESKSGLTVSTTVRTTAGVVQGLVRDGVHVFLGVPYAAPPLGELRFRPPAPPMAWSGARLATQPGANVRQSAIDEPLHSVFAAAAPAGDDCLNLNVWTPGPGDGRLPVLVFVHGGAFQVGSGSGPVYDGCAFARDGVICVTINYRLGAQGFLWIDGADGAGCFGLLDQLAALRWVQENIAAFGGDSSNVTLAAESAGGMSVATLMATPLARGLFRRAVVQSGSASATVTSETSATVAACVAEAAGLEVPGADAWRDLPLDRLIAAEQAVASKVLARRERRLPELAMAGVPMAFQPASGTEVLPVPPPAAIREGCASGIDLLTGSCADEVLSIIKAWPQQLGVGPGQDVPEPTVLALAALITGGRGVTPQAFVDAYREIHAGASLLEVAGAMLSDWGFRMPGLALAEAQADHAEVFLYELSWRGPGVWGAGHAADLPLVFDTFDTETGQFLTGGRDPRDLVAGVHGAWVSFAQDGRPRNTRLPDWPTFDTIGRQCLILDEPFRTVEAHRAREHALWESVAVSGGTR